MNLFFKVEDRTPTDSALEGAMERTLLFRTWKGIQEEVLSQMGPNQSILISTISESEYTELLKSK